VVAPASPAPTLPPLAAPGFAPDGKGWQVVVGGLGGLGLALAEWLVGAGARRVALTGRSGQPDAAAAGRIARLVGQGVEVRTIACDVSDAGATAAMFASLRKEAPVKGVFHSAMVLDDMPIKDLTAEALERTLPAKIAGIDNLDAATRSDRLDHFVAFSSIATMIGNHGQAAYVAANAYVEAVMAGRKAQGLPALAVGWGPITDAGYLAREADKARLIRKITGNATFTVGQALHALERMLTRAGSGADLPATVTISPMGWAGMLAALPLLKGPTYAKLAQLGRASGDGGEFEDLRGTLMALPADKAETRLVGFLTTEIARILRVPENALSASRSVSDFGMDSLMGVELGLAAQRVLGDDVPMMAISDDLSIRDIARKIVSHLHGGDAAQMTSLAANMAAQHLGENGVARLTEADPDASATTPQVAGAAS
jgi:NAD(P)-dependent dehydrogenase (short-subunit alcohol dehydrogenase family)/acyl carrier protein